MDYTNISPKREQINHIFKDMRSWLLPIILFLSIISISVTWTFLVGREYLDALHHGYIFKPAVDAMEGKVLFRDSFVQYGPLPSWIQAAGMLIFGKNILVIYVITGFFLASTYLLLYFLWCKILPKAYAVLSCLTILIIHPFADLPWPNYYLAFFVMLSMLLLINAYEKKHPGCLFFLSGFFCGLAALCRQQGILYFVGGLLSIIAMAIYQQQSKKELRRYLTSFIAGWGLVILFFLIWLFVNNAYNDWYLQTIKIIPVGYNRFNSSLWNNFTSAINSLFLGLRQWAQVDEVIRIWTLLLILSILGIISPLFYAFTHLPMTKEKMIIFIFSIFSFIGWSLAYPLPDNFRFLLGFAPMFGVLVYVLWVSFLRPIKPLLGTSLIGGIFCIIFLPYVITFTQTLMGMHDTEPPNIPLAGFFLRVFEAPPEGKVALSRPPVIKGLWLSKERVDFYDGLYDSIQKYLQDYPDTPLITTSSEVLLTTFKDNNENAHPFHHIMMYDQGIPGETGIQATRNLKLYPDYLIRLETFINERKPLIINYGEPITGYQPIYNSDGEKPIIWAIQRTPHPVITLQAPKDRAKKLIKRVGKKLFAREIYPFYSASVEPSGIADPTNPLENLIDNNSDTFTDLSTDTPQKIAIQLNFYKKECIGSLEILARRRYFNNLPNAFFVSFCDETGKCEDKNDFPLNINQNTQIIYVDFNHPAEAESMVISIKTIPYNNKNIFEAAEVTALAGICAKGAESDPE